MKKSGVLNKEISTIIASMGHYDELTICDAGLPIPVNVCRIDLAVLPGVPDLLSVLQAIESDLLVQQIILTKELKDQNPKFELKIRELFYSVDVKYISHEEFKNRSKNSRAVIRTGECTPYANIILVSGVIF